MKKSAHAHSALIQNRQFHARIARKEWGHSNEVGRKINFVSCIDWILFFNILNIYQDFLVPKNAKL